VQPQVLQLAMERVVGQETSAKEAAPEGVMKQHQLMVAILFLAKAQALEEGESILIWLMQLQLLLN
jgi:hypothetical protein